MDRFYSAKVLYKIMKEEAYKVKVSEITTRQLNSLLKMQGIYMSDCTDYLYYKE